MDLVIVSVLSFAFVFLSYRQGVRDAARIYENTNLSAFERIKKARPHEESDAERIARVTLENIENYGTAAPQQEVK